MPKPWLALFCLKVAAWAWAEGLGRSYAGGRLGVAIWAYMVDGWQAGVGIGLLYMGWGRGEKKKDLGVG